MKKCKIKKMVMGGFAQSEPKLKSADGEGYLTQGAVSGVTTGASLGTQIMPVWGTAIGAAVGGIGGLLMGAGKRRQANRKYRFGQ